MVIPPKVWVKWDHVISLFISCQSTRFKARAKGFTEGLASHPHPIHTHLPWHSPAFPQSFTSLPFTHFALVSRLKAYALRYMNSLPLFVMLSLGAHMALNLTSYSPLLKCHFLWLQHLKLLSYPSCTSRSVFFHCTYHLLIYYITCFVYCLSPPVEHKLHKRKTFYFAQGKTPHRCLVSK